MSDKKRINQIAKETGLSNTELVATAQSLGFEVKSHSSSVTAEQAEKIIQGVKTGTDTIVKPAEKTVKAKTKTVPETAKSKQEDHPRTFAGKAVVEDPAILAIIKEKEEAKKAAKTEAEPIEEVITTEKPKVVSQLKNLNLKPQQKLKKQRLKK